MSHAELLREGIYFYGHLYDPLLLPSMRYDELEAIPWPSLDDPSRPLPYMGTSETFMANMFCDLHKMHDGFHGFLCHTYSI